MTSDFTSEQKRYLEGLVAGLSVIGGKTAAEPVGPDAAHLKAMARFEAGGKKLSDPEKWKRDEHPFDGYERLKEQAASNSPPKPPDNFRWRFFGLFCVAPAQDSYMCRLRMPNGILKAHQLAGVADLAERYGGGYAHVTTRANLQVREIAPKDAVAMLEEIQDLGLCSRGSGADNIRNVTGDATAGISCQELLDTRPYAREWHFHILNDRSLYGLPRKFNVAFDGGGEIATLEETNDIGFHAVEVMGGPNSRMARSSPASGSSFCLAVSLATRILHATPALSSVHAKQQKWPMLLCAYSSVKAIAPTGPRLGSNTSSTDI